MPLSLGSGRLKSRLMTQTWSQCILKVVLFCAGNYEEEEEGSDADLLEQEEEEEEAEDVDHEWEERSGKLTDLCQDMSMN